METYTTIRRGFLRTAAGKKLTAAGISLTLTRAEYSANYHLFEVGIDAVPLGQTVGEKRCGLSRTSLRKIRAMVKAGAYRRMMAGQES